MRKSGWGCVSKVEGWRSGGGKVEGREGLDRGFTKVSRTFLQRTWEVEVQEVTVKWGQ